MKVKLNKEKIRRFCVYLKYSAPLILAVVLLASCFLPGVYFFYDGEAHEKQSLVSLCVKTWETVEPRFSEWDDMSLSEQGFVGGAAAGAVAFWLIVVLSLICGAYVMYMSLSALRLPPHSPEANRLKVWLRFVLPGRWALSLTLLIPVLPPLFPYLLAWLYDKYYLLDVTVLYRGLPPFIPVAAVALISLVIFFVSLPAEREYMLDMYRRYRLLRRPHAQSVTVEEGKEEENNREENGND